MKILVDCSGRKIQNEGGRTYVEYFLSQWSAMYGAELAPVFSKGEIPPQLARENTIHELPLRLPVSPMWRLWDLYVGLPRAIRAVKPDAAFFPGNVLSVGLPERLPTAVAVRLTIHYHYPSQFSPWRNGYLRAATMHAVHRANRVIVPSSSTADDLMRHARARRDKLVVIPHGVDLNRFHPSAGERIEPLMFLFVSRPYDYKGLLTTFRAVQHAASSLGTDGLQLLVVDGGVPEARRRALEQAACGLSIGSSVRLLGRVNHEELSVLYRRATALVLPTSCESFGHPFLEAAASGCPVITGSGFGIDEVIGPVAHQVAEHDHREIGDAMVAIANMSEQERGGAAVDLRRWAERFSWERTVAETRQVMSELVE